MDSAILRYKQPANMTSMQYAEDLNAKSWKVTDVYDESMLNDIFIEEVDPSICHSLWEY